MSATAALLLASTLNINMLSVIFGMCVKMYNHDVCKISEESERAK